MTENTENTLTAYLGSEFQQRLIWQLLVEPEFAEKIISDLAIEYFDDPNLKRLFIIMLEYYKEFDKVPNLQNQSVHQAINKYKTPNNTIEEESLFAVIKRVELWNERIINKQMLYDGDVVQKSTSAFIKQQEYRKLAESIMNKVKNGEIKNKHNIAAIEDKFQKISHIGEEDDDSESVTEGIGKALRKEFRETIPTGIGAIDSLTGNGLGKGEIGVILTPSGVGKTTALTIIANTAFELEQNVAQIIFEDTKDQIKRKHFTIWAESALSRLNEDEENERVFNIADAKAREMEGKGRLIIKRFSQEDTTMKDVRNWMLGYQKKWGFKFDILVLDYLDCLESHKKQDRTESELTIIKGFEALSSDFDIPAWTAIQSNRSGFGSEFVEAHQTGGSIKRVQKAHFFMSVAKTPAQQEANFANIRIIKARFAKDGQTFEDCVFNNDTMKIDIDDPRYVYTKTYKNLKHYDEADIDKLEKKANTINEIHVAISQHDEGALIEKINTEDVNSLLRSNAVPEDNIDNINISTERTDLSPKDIKIANEVVDEGATEGAIEGATEGASNAGLLELDENADIETLDDGVSDGVSDVVKDDLMDFSGDITTKLPVITIPEVKLVPTEEVQPQSKQEFVPSAGNDVRKLEEKDIDEVMKQIQATDPDAPQGDHKSINDMLVKKRDYQHVVQKE